MFTKYYYQGQDGIPNMVENREDDEISMILLKKSSFILQCWSKVWHILCYDFPVTPLWEGG